MVICSLFSAMKKRKSSFFRFGKRAGMNYSSVAYCFTVKLIILQAIWRSARAVSSDLVESGKSFAVCELKFLGILSFF